MGRIEVYEMSSMDLIKASRAMLADDTSNAVTKLKTELAYIKDSMVDEINRESDSIKKELSTMKNEMKSEIHKVKDDFNIVRKDIKDDLNNIKKETRSIRDNSQHFRDESNQQITTEMSKLEYKIGSIH